MSRKILGLDIRTGAVAAVLLQSRLKGATVEACAYSPVSGQTEMQDAIAACLADLAKQADIAGAVCVAAYPSEKIFYRNIAVPFREQKKIRQILPYELEPALPLPVENLIIDFCDTGLAGVDGSTGILAGAAEFSGLKSLLDILADLRLAPTVVTSGSFVAASWIARSGRLSDGHCLLVDVGRNNCSVFALAAGRVCYARSFPLRRDDRTQAAAIGHHLRQTFAPLEDILQAPVKPECIFLTGHGAEDKALAEEIARESDLPVRWADLAESSAGGLKINAGADWRPNRLNNACALALAESEGLAVLNFRRGPLAHRKRWEEHRKHLAVTAILALALLAFSFFDVVIDNYMMGERVARLDRQITAIFSATFPDIRRIVNPLAQMQEEIKKIQGQSLFPDSFGNQVRNIDILRDISALIPVNIEVSLNRIVIGPGSVTISGYTDTFNSVNNIQRQLQGSRLFKTVIINSANIEKTGNRVSFNLNIQL